MMTLYIPLLQFEPFVLIAKTLAQTLAFMMHTDMTAPL